MICCPVYVVQREPHHFAEHDPRDVLATGRSVSMIAHHAKGLSNLKKGAVTESLLKLSLPAVSAALSCRSP